MGYVETEGIVIRKHNLADADRIVVVLTEKEGMIRGVANGAKRLKSKFSSSLEFFSRIHLNYFQKEAKDLVVIKDTDLVESVFGRLSNPRFYETFAEIADLLIKFTPPYEPNRRLYQMTRHCLAAVIEDESRIPSVRLYFEIWLLKLGGFLPSWERCRSCGKDIGIEDAAVLQIDFQIECGKCKGSYEYITGGVRELFSLAQRNSPANFADRTKERVDDLTQVLRIVGRLSDAVLERSPLPAGETRLKAYNE